MNEQLHAVVHGRVQGVGFRHNTLVMAQRLNLVGWVRNLPDRTVETVAEGPPTALRDFERYLRAGPLGATVTEVDLNWRKASGDFDSFAIR